MRVLVPTLKYTAYSKGIVFDNVFCTYISEDELAKLGISKELHHSISEFAGDKFGYNEANQSVRSRTNNDQPFVVRRDYRIRLETIKEQYNFQGKKLAYLKEHGVKCVLGYILPISKAAQFLHL